MSAPWLAPASPHAKLGEDVSGPKDYLYLRIFATLEKRRHADQADIVVPHDCILGIIAGNFEDILEHCIYHVSIDSRVLGRCKLWSRMLTFKAFSASLLIEVFLATVVGNMSTILLDSTKGEYLVSLDLSERGFVQIFERWKVDSALGLGLDKGPGVLDHFGYS